MPPVGPTNFAIMTKGFKGDIKAGVSIGVGAGFTDLFYILVAFGGVSAIYAVFPVSLKNLLINEEIYFKLGLTILGSLVVIIYGFKIMKMKILNDGEDEPFEQEEILDIKEKVDETLEKTEEGIAKIIHKKPSPKNGESITGNFFTGILLCLSSVTLPASWVAIVSFLQSYGIIDTRFWSGLGLAAGVLVGTTAWFYTLVKFVKINSHRIKPKTLNRINITVGVILILIGAVLLIKAVDFAYTILNS